MAFTLDQAHAITRLKETEASIATSVMLANEKAIASAAVCSVIEVTRAIFSLNNSVDAMSEKVTAGSDNLTAAIKAATEQSVESSRESANLAAKSAKLSAQLNWLTKWIIGAAIISAVAAIIQAGAVVHQIWYPSPPQIILLPASAPQVQR